MIEYRYVRTDAAGRSKVIAVTASAPTKTTGCEPEREATFTCVDHPPGGRIRYVLQAFRTSPGGDTRCKTVASPCIGPASTTPKQVSLASSGSGPVPSATSGALRPPKSSTPGATSSGATLHATASPSATPTVHPDVLGEPRTHRPARGGPLAAASLALAAQVVAHVMAARRPGRRS